MKTIANTTIMSLLLTVVMLVSCSTEGDMLDDMSKVEASATTGVEASVSCSIHTVMTKADGNTQAAEGTEASVANAIFFLVKNGEVLSSANVGSEIYTKNQSGLQVVAVAGITPEMNAALSALRTVDEITNYTLNNVSLFTKIGTADVKFADTKEDRAEVAVDVTQVTARIDLVKVAITKTAADKVSLTKVELFNQVVSGKLNGTVVAQTGTATGTLNATSDGSSPLYSFAGQQVSLRLTFDVDGQEVVKAFTVKHNGSNEVKAGYVYRVTVNATLVGGNVEPEVTFEVADWKTATVTGNLTGY